VKKTNSSASYRSRLSLHPQRQHNTPESVASAITATMEGTGGRVYGGHVFVMEGEVTFVGCNFW